MPTRPTCLQRCLFTLLGCLVVVPVVAGGDDEDKAKIEGVWRMVGQLTENGDVRELGAGRRAVKFIMGGQWCVTAYDEKTGQVVYHHGGTYTFDGQKYSEKVKFVAPLRSVGTLNTSFQFGIRFEGNRLIQKGSGNSFNEVWERVQAEKE